MRVLVVGSGGREHALVLGARRQPAADEAVVRAGQPRHRGRSPRTCRSACSTSPALVAFAQDNEVDLVVPGPEAPLVAGITDAMEAAGIACCGPTAAAAQLEGSKAFTKEICDAAGIPTARWERFDDAGAARAFVRRRGAPIVVKADGLAAGKGVVVAPTEAEAVAAIDAMYGGAARFGEAGAPVVIEECLNGEEVTLFALCDGANALALGAAQDHKRVGDGDTGPNTGGMGAYRPPPALRPRSSRRRRWRGIIRPALAEMARQGTPFRGILYAGLMLTADGPKLIEFNVRFGDPECQVLLPRLKSDLLAALQAACDGELGAFDLRWHEVASIAVVMAARGYPEAPELAFADPRPRRGRGGGGCAGVPRRHGGARRAAGLGRRAGADGLRQRGGSRGGPRGGLSGRGRDRLAGRVFAAATSAGAHLQRRGLAPRAELAYSRRVRRGVEVMELDRRRFLKLSGATLAASSIGALGFGAAGEALAATVRPFKLERTTETRNTCPYCSVACGVLIYSLGDRAKNAKAKHHPYRGRPGPPGQPRHALPEGRGAARLRAQRRPG